jgi:hypothetical protein
MKKEEKKIGSKECDIPDALQILAENDSVEVFG